MPRSHLLLARIRRPYAPEIERYLRRPQIIRGGLRVMHPRAFLYLYRAHGTPREYQAELLFLSFLGSPKQLYTPQPCRRAVPRRPYVARTVILRLRRPHEFHGRRRASSLQRLYGSRRFFCLKKFKLRRVATLMPGLHLDCDQSTEPVSCPYPLFRTASVRRQEAAVRFSYGFTSLYKFKKLLARRYVVGVIAQSPHGHRTDDSR